MGAKILYKDISPTAKLLCVPSSEDKISWCNIEQLNRDSGNFRNYSSCEHNRRVLDGNAINMKYDGDFGFWSKQMSKDDCTFDKNPTITFIFSEPVSFVGLTLTFERNNNEFSTDFNVKYYLDGSLLKNNDYKNDSVQIFLNNSIDPCNKVVIEFRKTNIPRRYLKLSLIDYGVIRSFEGKELLDVKVNEDISLLSTEVSVNTMDFTFTSKTSIDYMFQKKQPLICYFNENLIGTFFIEKAIRKGKDMWTLNNGDFISVLNNFSYTGGIFNQVKASVILHDILDPWNIPFELEASFNDIELTGYLPVASARECVQQVLFACCAVADTTRSSIVRIYSGDVQLDADLGKRIMKNPTFEKNEKVTEVRLTQYRYEIKNEREKVASGTATGEVEIIFSSPFGELSLSGGTITKSGANYAIIQANGQYELTGKRYEANTTVITKKNPRTNVVDLQNIVEVTDATLVSASNVSMVLEKLYAYCMRTDIAKIKAPADYVSVGDYISFESVDLGEKKKGHVISNSYNLNGKKIVIDCEVLEDE